jgi:hypothetical protein
MDDGEEDRLLSRAETSSRPWLRATIIISIETCIRQSELAGLVWGRGRLDTEYPRHATGRDVALIGNFAPHPVATPEFWANLKRHFASRKTPCVQFVCIKALPPGLLHGNKFWQLLRTFIISPGAVERPLRLPRMPRAVGRPPDWNQLLADFHSMSGPILQAWAWWSSRQVFPT